MNGLDSKEFTDELFLMASNDGDAYRDKNPDRAVVHAFREFQARRRAEEREAFRAARKTLTDDLKQRWNES